jgi:hypothetical protein
MYILFILVSNVSRGFDITDESYYILAAQYQNEIFSTLKHDGYYTGVLFYLSGYNLSYFRLFGIFILLASSYWFAIELYKYIANKFQFTLNNFDRLLFISTICISVLSYYKYWLLTPSYNWLALLSVISVFTFMIRIVNNKEINYDRYISIDYLLLSFSFSMAFMAKPTTAMVLTIVSILFVIYEYKNINLKKALISILIFTIMIVSLHIILLDDGFNNYIYRLTEGMERLALMGGGHTLESRYFDMINLFQIFFFEKFYFHQVSKIYLYIFIIILVVLHFLRNKINVLSIYLVLMAIILSVYSYVLFKNSINIEYKFIWIRVIEIFILNTIFIFLSTIFIDNKKELLKKLGSIIPLLIIIILGSIAYKFGSNNQIIYAISSSMVFVISSILIVNFIFDKILGIRFFSLLMSIILSIFIYFLIQNAYNHPYRLITDISQQKYNVELLGELKVDSRQKKYIDTLQELEKKYNPKNKKITLLDMTGASSGANIILSAAFFGEQWLSGGYKGSIPYVTRILLSYKNTEKIKKAWILVAPKGRRKIPLNILNKVGLNFPDDYKKVGVFRTAHRNEVQQLWIPK